MKKEKTGLRKSYKIRFVFRICVFAFTVFMYFTYPESFGMIAGSGFFKELSWLHFLWLVWIADMIIQLIPAGNYLSLGSLKQFKGFYKPIKKLLDRKELANFIKISWVQSLKVALVWIMILSAVGLLRFLDFIGHRELLLISVVFYVLDLTFVLFWCPFRVLILKNRCCTTCRIFNWDHMMMFSPLLFVPGFYSLSLFGFSAAVMLIWEICFYMHPERFCEETNEALRCSSYTDKLCGTKNCRL